MEIKRRSVLVGGGAVGAALLGGGTGAAPAAAAAPSPLLQSQPHRTGTPSVVGLHLQFGTDPSSEMTVSWITPQTVRRPQARLGTPEGGLGQVVDAETRTYRDGLSNDEVYVHHARFTGLRPETTYLYSAGHDGTTPETGSFTTAPRGRRPFTFTSFGDQATPDLRRVVTLPKGVQSPSGSHPLYTSSQIGSPAAADIVAAVERVGPLFNLLNGDLCYAAIGGYFGQSRVDTWSDWFINNSRSTRFRPWMPCAGNHENEKANGPIGATGYQTYFTLPKSSADSDEETRGMWYAFTVGSVRFISLANDDVAIQDGGDSYVRGYSGGAQQRWMERELKTARADRGIDWIVVCMHQPFISSSKASNGSDLGVREAWGPLFDAYGSAATSTTTSARTLCAERSRTGPAPPSRSRRAPISSTPAGEPCI